MSNQTPPPIPPAPGSGSPATPPPGQNPWENVAGNAAQSFGDSISGVTHPGFFAGLFDFSFSKFITTKVLGVLYGLITVAIVVGYIIAVIVGFQANIGLGFVALIFGPILALVYLIFARITLEFYAAAIRTASNTSALVSQGSRTR